MGVRHRRWMRSACDQSSEVRHVYQVQRAYRVRNLSHSRKIDHSRIRTASADDQLRPMLFSQLLQLFVIDRLRLFSHTVGNDVVGLAGKVQWMSMREMPAHGEVQSHDGVARLDDR